MFKFKTPIVLLLALVISGCASHSNFGKYPEYFERGAYLSPFDQEYRVMAINSDAFVELGYTLWDRGDKPEAFRQFLKSAKQDNPYGQFITAYLLSVGQGTKRNMEKAYEWYQRSAREDNSYAQYNLGYLYSEGYKIRLEFPDEKKDLDLSIHGVKSIFKGDEFKQDLSEAEKWYSKAAEKDFFPAMNKLAYLWACQGIKLDKAEHYARRALEIYPGNPEIIDTLGWTLYKEGKLKEAAAQLELALKLQPDEPIIKDHLGDVYNSMGSREQALEMWQSAQTKDPALEKTIKDKMGKLNKELSEKAANQK